MPAPDSEDALIADCSVERMKSIAKAFQLTNFSRLRKEALHALLADHMSSIAECGTCGGGVCDPLSHYFTPVINNAGSNVSSPDRHIMGQLGDGGLDDEFYQDGDGHPVPFVRNQVTDPGTTPDLAAVIHQGGLDAAAVSARDTESQQQVDPIQ